MTGADEAFRAQYGPWAVVTGASSGIGRALAIELARRGVHLVVVARSAAALESLATDLATRDGVEVRVLPLDLSRPDAVATMAETTRSLDVGLLAFSAGFGTSGPLLLGDPAVEREMLRVNCEATLNGVLAFAPRLVRRGRGGLILFGSIVGFQGVPGAAHYAATKAYVQSLAEGLHVELAGAGVDVLAVAPGPVHTGFAARARMQLGAALTPETVARATLRALGRRTTVLPGALSMILGLGLAMLPRWARVRVMGGVMRGMVASVP